MTRAAKILARNPRLKKQMDDAMAEPSSRRREKGQRKQAGRSPSSAEKAAPAILDWLVGRGEIEEWEDNNTRSHQFVLLGARGTDGGSERCNYTPDFVGWHRRVTVISHIIEVKGGFVREDARIKFKMFQLLPEHKDRRFIWCELKPWGWLVKFWMGGRLERKEKVTFETLMRKGK